MGANLKVFLAMDILVVEDQFQVLCSKQRIANKSRMKVKKSPVQRLFRGQPMIIISALKIKKIRQNYPKMNLIKQKNQTSSQQQKGQTTEEQQSLGLQSPVEVCPPVPIIKTFHYISILLNFRQVYTIRRLIIDYKRFVAIATIYFGNRRFYSFILST